MLVISTILLAGSRFSFRLWWRQSWDLTLLFFVLLLGLIYSSDISLGLRQLETSLSLLGVPIIVAGVASCSNRLRPHAFYAFGLGVVVASFICLARAIFLFLQSGDWSVFFYTQFTNTVSSHPTYFAYYVIFCCTYTLYKLYYELPASFVVGGVSAAIYLFIILLLTGGQTAFISLLLVFSFFISKYLLEEKTRRTSTVALVIVFLSLGWVGLTILLQTNDLFSALQGQNDYWERLTLWNSAFSASSNIWVGVGTGDYLTVLNEYYRSHEMSEFARKNMNAHNEFIQVYFSNGLLGLIALILAIGRPLYLATRHRDVLTILLYFPFLLYGVTEVFLGRYQGVVFFGFAHQLCISHLVALDSRRFL